MVIRVVRPVIWNYVHQLLKLDVFDNHGAFVAHAHGTVVACSGVMPHGPSTSASMVAGCDSLMPPDPMPAALVKDCGCGCGIAAWLPLFLSS